MEIFQIFLLISVVTCNTYTDEDSDYLTYDVPEEREYDSGDYKSSEIPLATQTFKAWQFKALDYINDLRDKGNLPLLEMNEEHTNDVQIWAEKVACKRPQDREDIKGQRAMKFKIDLSYKFSHPPSRSRSILLKAAIDNWFDHYKYFNCNVPITMEEVYSGAEKFQKAGPYTVIMGKQYETVAFAVAACPQSHSVLVIARFDYDKKNFNRIITKELKNQNIEFADRDYLDMTKLAACPDDFINK